MAAIHVWYSLQKGTGFCQLGTNVGLLMTVCLFYITPETAPLFDRQVHGQDVALKTMMMLNYFYVTSRSSGVSVEEKAIYVFLSKLTLVVLLWAQCTDTLVGRRIEFMYCINYQNLTW